MLLQVIKVSNPVVELVQLSKFKAHPILLSAFRCHPFGVRQENPNLCLKLGFNLRIECNLTFENSISPLLKGEQQVSA